MYVAAICTLVMPYYLVGLQYHRFITTIDGNVYHCRQLNKFISAIDIMGENDPNHVSEQIYRIFNAFRAVHLAKQSINEHFKWSLILCTFNDFLQYTVSGYSVTYTKSVLFKGLYAIYLIPKLVHTMKLATVCQHAYEEVIDDELY